MFVHIVVAVAGAIVIYSWACVGSKIRGESIITLHSVSVIGANASIIIATSVVVGAFNVDARGVGVYGRAVQVALAVEVVLPTVTRSKVAISIRMFAAVNLMTPAGIIRPRPAHVADNIQCESKNPS